MNITIDRPLTLELTMADNSNKLQEFNILIKAGKLETIEDFIEFVSSFTFTHFDFGCAGSHIWVCEMNELNRLLLITK